jgi:hypothetical protein
VGSTGGGRCAPFEQPDRRIQRGWTEVHVPLRRGEILMSGGFLNRPRGCAPHGQMRTEGMPQHMDTAVHLCASCGTSDQPLHDLLCERLTCVVAQYAWASQMAMGS